MTAWLGYLGWLLVLAALGYGIHLIRQRLRGTAQGRAPAFGGAQARGGLSEREAALVAQARADARSAAPAVAAPAPREIAAVPPTKAQFAAPDGILKSAGNPAVRKAFAQAMKEVETKTYDPGLWAMALVDSNGDERMARLAYMKARAADLVWADARDTERDDRT